MDNQEPSISDDTVLRRPSQSAEDSEVTGGVQTPDVADTTAKQNAAEQNAAQQQAAAEASGKPVVDNQADGDLERAQTVIRKASDSGGSRGRDHVGRTPADIAQVLVGQHLNQYYLEQLVGGGGMGAVFRAHDQQLDRIVALKVIPFVGNDVELQRRFRNEAQNAAKLDHPRIARIFDAGSHDDWHYIVFEYIQGTNLRDLVQRDGLRRLDDAIFFTSQVAQALSHAAERGIVHRDIKPSNVLISQDGEVKLVDMGLARSDNLDLSEDMTATGVTLGTFDYISPEQALDPRDADVRSDIYSLGCTLYFMLTGQAPYTGGTMLQKLLSHGNAPPPDPRLLREELPEEVVSVMHRMMAKDPKARYQNARDLLDDLSELAYRFDLGRAKTDLVFSQPSRSLDGLLRLQSHLPWMIAVLLVLMVAGYLQIQGTADRDSFVVQQPPRMMRGNAAARKSDQSDAGDSIPSGENASAADQGVPITNGPANNRVPNETASNGSSGGPSEEIDGEPFLVDGMGPSGTESPNQSGPFDSTTEENLSAGGESTDRPLDGNVDAGSSFAESAAQPPQLGVDLPIPAALTESSLENVDARSPGSNAASTALEALANPPGGMPRVPNSGSSDLLLGADGSSISGASSVAASLPSPQCVRIVPTSSLALATRVDQVGRDADGAVLVASLNAAMEMAMRFGVQRVEIAVPEMVSGPVAVPADYMTFISTVGRTTIRLVSTDTMAIGRSEMINVGNSRCQFKNLDFYWEVAEEQVDGGAMFVVNDNRQVRMSDCTFTVVNRAKHEGVVFFDIITDPEVLPDNETLPGRMFNPDEDALPLVAIQLDNSIARGEATLIRMDYAVALQFVWKNGLLAISGRMIETSGARRRPSLVSSPLQISLTNLTAEIPKGLIRMKLGPTGVFPVPIERVANQCVFLVNEGQPHVEFDGLATLSEQQSWLKLRGEANAYVGSTNLNDPLLLISDLEGNEATTFMSDLLSESLTWSTERSPRWSVFWSTQQTRTPVYHRITPATYRQDGVVYAGFQELSLPKLP